MATTLATLVTTVFRTVLVKTAVVVVLVDVAVVVVLAVVTDVVEVDISTKAYRRLSGPNNKDQGCVPQKKKPYEKSHRKWKGRILNKTN